MFSNRNRTSTTTSIPLHALHVDIFYCSHHKWTVPVAGPGELDGWRRGVLPLSRRALLCLERAWPYGLERPGVVSSKRPKQSPAGELGFWGTAKQQNDWGDWFWLKHRLFFGLRIPSHTEMEMDSCAELLTLVASVQIDANRRGYPVIWELSSIDLESVCKEFQQKLLKGCIAGCLNVVKHAWCPTRISRVSLVISLMRIDCMIYIYIIIYIYIHIYIYI